MTDATADDLTQYLVVHTDDEDNNHDLFVTAKDVFGALDLWKKYYDFEDDQDLDDVRVFAVPAKSAVPAAQSWDEMVDLSVDVAPAPAP